MEQQLQVWLRICLFFGIYVSATKCMDRGEGNDVRAYWLQRGYNCVLSVGFCAVFVCSIRWFTYPAGLELNWVVTTILFVSRFLTNALILMEAVYKQQQHAHFLQILQTLEASLWLQFKWRVESTTLLWQIKRSFKYHLALSALGILPFMVSTFVLLDYGGYFWQGLWFICSVRVRTLQLLVYLRILRHFLSGLCLQLQQLVAFRKTPQLRLLDFDYGRLGTLRHLLAIKEAYVLIYEAFALLNDFAGWSLYGILITYIFDLSSNFYWLLQSFDNFRGRRYYFLADLWWFLPITALVFDLCYLCDNCRQMGCIVAHWLSQLISLSSKKVTRPYQLILQQFAMQLQLQRIEVTAHTFCVLDFRFMMSICTAMAMHLVILLQF
ncbi:putative gustatory receptor 39b [Zeugodacus cucurbitae]|uniref:putative gustatory receptor 39b n=1 Tax=Zeugodacus cucurbitae TaxID=28588 RepID=UPI0023D91630|nr:putative gustatory receptor 39b [Zeugodacus cucurbitae]